MNKLEKPLEKLQGLLEKLSYRQWLMLAAAVSIFLGVAVFFSLSGSQEQEEKPNEAPRVSVVVAKQDIPERVLVKESMLEMKQVPSDVLPADAVTDMMAVIDKPASVPIQKGDVLTSKKVLVDPRLAGFTGLIPENCRAISIAITDVTGVAGFAQPGDYVDVMVVSKGKERITGELLLQNVMLLGINKTGGDGAGNIKSADGEQKDDKNKNSDNKEKAQNTNASNVQASGDAMATATLALTPEDALKLAVASQDGTLYLDLRPIHPRDAFTIHTDFFRRLESGTASGNAAPSNAPQSTGATPAPRASVPATSYAPQAVPSGGSTQGAASAPKPGNGIEIYRGTTASWE